MNKAAIIVAVSMLVSRVLGIFREMLLAHAAGVSLEKNALDLAFMIPDILNHVVSTGFLSIIFIPIFTGYKVAGDEKAGWKFFSNVLNTFGIALLILVVPAFIWMKELIALLTVDGVTPELLERATYYGRIILPGQIFIFVGSILVGLAPLLALLPLLLALAGKGVFLIELTLPYIDGILHHRFVRSLFTTYNRHQSQVLQVAVAILHHHLVGIGRCNGQHTTEHRHVHRHGHTHQRLFKAHW